MSPNPSWLESSFLRALLGQIYPKIRAIAVGLSKNKELLVRMYLDDIPTQEDEENLSIIVTNVLADISDNEVINKVKEECLQSKSPPRDLDPLGGFIYARKEKW